MNDMSQTIARENDDPKARDWLRTLAQYREPILWRSLLEIALTFIPFVALWAAAWWALSISVILSFAISIVAGAFLVRMFMIQHDCGHRAFFKARAANDWVGRAIGVLTLTPYEMWRHAHSVHHASHGNLEKRGTGDIDTATVEEFRAMSWLQKLKYRAYRHPITLFVIGPIYMYFFKNRAPFEFLGQRKFWFSTMGTNIGIAAVAAGLIYLIGWSAFLLVFLPTTFVAGSVGIWLFYVQHQFEDTLWDEDIDWDLHDAALYGSSYYDLPRPLRWMTANIGVHHVHHLYSRIPFYRLSQVLKDHPQLTEIRRLSIWESMTCVRLQLWDPVSRRMITYAESRTI